MSKVINLHQHEDPPHEVYEVDEFDDVEVAIALLDDLRGNRDRAEVAFRTQEARVVEMLEARHEKRATTPLNGGKQATLVIATRVVYDEARILDELDDVNLNRVTKYVLDRQKLADAVSKGQIMAEWLAERCEVKENKPFVKISDLDEQEPTE
jgi:epoxyqueuosine reductase QueG